MIFFLFLVDSLNWKLADWEILDYDKCVWLSVENFISSSGQCKRNLKQVNIHLQRSSSILSSFFYWYKVFLNELETGEDEPCSGWLITSQKFDKNEVWSSFGCKKLVSLLSRHAIYEWDLWQKKFIPFIL